MALDEQHLDPIARAAEKQASRDEDERALAAGEKSRDDLRRENGFFFGLEVRPVARAPRRPRK